MYMRTVRISVKPDELQRMKELYVSQIIPVLEKTSGCRYAGLLQSTNNADDCLSLTLWNTREDAQTYEASGAFRALIQASQPYFSESSDLELRLTADLKIEYAAAAEGPVVSNYDVIGSEESGPVERLFVRMVSLKLRPGKLEDFRRMYTKHVVPLLRSIEGCRFAFLAEQPGWTNEVLSVTGWDKSETADVYERDGRFAAVLESQRHLLSELYDWKRAGEEQSNVKIATSDDVAIDRFIVLVGQVFRQ